MVDILVGPRQSRDERRRELELAQTGCGDAVSFVSEQPRPQFCVRFRLEKPEMHEAATFDAGCIAHHRAAELAGHFAHVTRRHRSEEHTSELQSLMRISYA